MMKPAEELHAAATKIRDAHAGLVALSARTDIRGPMLDLSEWSELFDVDSRGEYPEVNVWIATMSPAIAAPLATWTEAP